MNTPETRMEEDGLPGFLDDTETVETAEAIGEGTEEETFDEEPDDFDDSEEHEEESDPQLYRSEERPLRTHRRSRQPASRGGTISTVIAVLCWVVAGVLVSTSDALPALPEYGVTPMTVFLLGAVALAVANVRRATARLQNTVTAMSNAGHIELQRALASLGSTPVKAGEGHEEVAQHVLLALQRQDEKINNLTRAIKMYGKPLVDIANHGTELGAMLDKLRGTVETGNDTIRREFGELSEKIGSDEGSTRLAALGEGIDKLEVAVQAISQRLEDSETRKTLVRLEDTTRDIQGEVSRLLLGESIDKATSRLDGKLDQVTDQIARGLGQLREDNFGDLETQVRDIQREMAAVATAVAQIQAALKSRPTDDATAPRRRPATPTAPEATSPGGTAEPATTTDSNGSGYQTGKRKSGGKNVLGAIAKLKQMKN